MRLLIVMKKVKVFGHLSPDTDSVLSAIVYSWFLSSTEDIEAKPYALGEINKETAFALKFAEFEVPEILDTLESGEYIGIVDTNNPEELPKDIQKCEVVGIVDHHKLTGGISTNSPISVIIKPLGSTSTVLWTMCKEENLEIPSNIAKLMVSCILSDTLNLTSPTTTSRDKSALEELSKVASVDIDKYAEELFAAKSDLTGVSAEDIILMDSKKVETSGKTVRVSVLETTKTDNVLDMESEVRESMEKVKKREELDYFFFFVVDILKGQSILIILSKGEEVIAKSAFGTNIEDSRSTLDGVVSRKKQMLPKIMEAIEKS